MMRLRLIEKRDFEAAIDLWRTSPWASVSATDNPDAMAVFVQRNPGCSWIAEDNGILVATVLAGHDGRRGYVYHLVVAESHRGRGIGKALLQKALGSLREHGIIKCHAMVIEDNPAAEYFWSRPGWQPQPTTQYSTMLTTEDE